MKLRDKKQLGNLITDYKLWIAFIEQFLEDHNITNKQINRQLNFLKDKLTKLLQINNIPIIIDNLLMVDDSLVYIQTQIPKLALQPS
jgi:chromosome condensin MukBEF complex kleisin-like MukF subunit